MMLGYPCLARQQLPWVLSQLLALIVTLIATTSEAHHNGPKIVTYGEPCHSGPHNLPYQIESPVIPYTSSPPPPHLGPPGGRYYGYGICEVPNQRPNPVNVGFQFPISIQQPAPPQQRYEEECPRRPVHKKFYDFGIQCGPRGPKPPVLGRFDFGVETSVPGPKPPPPNPSNPFQVRVEPVGEPPSTPSLWGPLPVSIERPAYVPHHTASPPHVPRLTGLTSTIDTLLIPACEIPMDGQPGGSSQHPYSGPFGGGPFGGGPSGGGPFDDGPPGGGPGGSPFGGSPFGGSPFGGSPFGGSPFGPGSGSPSNRQSDGFPCQ